MHRPGVELAISRSQVRRPNHYTTEPPLQHFCEFCTLLGLGIFSNLTYSESKWPAAECSEERMRDIVSQTSAISRGGLGVVPAFSEPPGKAEGGGRRPSMGGEAVGYGRTKVGDGTMPRPSASEPP